MHRQAPAGGKGTGGTLAAREGRADAVGLAGRRVVRGVVLAPDAVAEIPARADGPRAAFAPGVVAGTGVAVELPDAVCPFGEPLAFVQVGRVVFAVVASLVGRKQLEIDEPHVHVDLCEPVAVAHVRFSFPTPLAGGVMASSSDI